MWHALAEGKSPAEVAAVLAGEYDAAQSVLLHDCVTLVDELVARGLLERKDP